MSETTDRKVALVTGANRGIGLEIARQLGKKGLTVLVGARDAAKGEEAAAKLREEGIDARSVQLDVTNEASVRVAAAWVAENVGRLDALVNNAGGAWDFTPQPIQPSEMSLELVRKTMDLNFLSALAVTQAFLPLIKKSPAGRIVNVSSLMGSQKDILDPKSPLDGFLAPAYRLSKSALNALTALFAKELRDTNIKVNAACPGWVATDLGVPDWLRAAMGGTGPALPVEQGADTPVWLATLPDDGPTGGFFRQREPIAW